MAISDDELIHLFKQLPEKAKQSALDYIQYLSVQDRPDWKEIAQLDPDDTPRSEEELKQLHSDEGFITGEVAKCEFNLKVDLP